jgi:hypothetical protein
MKSRERAQQGRRRSMRRSPNSMYVDYHFPEMGEIRRNRYMQNFLTTEAMRMSNAQLESAPFEGDKAYKNYIVGATDKLLQDISSQGDYENMTTAITGAANDFKIKTLPIAKNKQIYDAYKEKLKEDYDNGKLKYYDYTRTLDWAEKSYKGLKTGPDGKIDNTSYFRGVNPVYDPDIPKLIRENLQNLVPDAIIDEKGIVGMQDGMYKISTYDGIKYVDANKVDAAMRIVMEDRSVTDYITRQGELFTYDMDPDNATEYLNNHITASNQQIATIDEQIANSASEEDKEYLRAYREKLVQERANLQTYMQDTDPSQYGGAVAKLKSNDIYNMYTQAARDKYTYTQQTRKYDEEYDGVYMAKLKSSLDDDTVMSPNFTITGTGVEIRSPYGRNAYETKEYLSDTQKALNDLAKEYNDAGPNMSEGRKASYEQQMGILTARMDIQEALLEQKYGISNPEAIQTEEYQRLTKEIETTRKQLDDARAFMTSGTLYGAALASGPLAPTAYAMAGIDWAGASLEYDNAIEARDNYMRSQGFTDMTDGLRTIFPELATTSSVSDFTPKQAKAIDEFVEARWATPPKLQAFEASSLGADGKGDLQYIDEILTVGAEGDYADPEGWKLASPVLFTEGSLGHFGRAAQLTYTGNKTGKTHRFYVPLDQVGITDSDLGILHRPWNDIATLVEEMSDLENMQEHTFRVSAQTAEGVIPGFLDVDLTKQIPRAKTRMGDHESNWYNYNHPEFIKLVNSGNIKLSAH